MTRRHPRYPRLRVRGRRWGRAGRLAVAWAVGIAMVFGVAGTFTAVAGSRPAHAAAAGAGSSLPRPARQTAPRPVAAGPQAPPAAPAVPGTIPGARPVRCHRGPVLTTPGAPVSACPSPRSSGSAQPSRCVHGPVLTTPGAGVPVCRSPRPSPAPSTARPLQPPGGDHWYNPLNWLWKGLQWLDGGLIHAATVGVQRTVLTSADVTDEGRVRDLWTTSMAVADSLLVLVVIAAGVVMMTHDSLQIRYGIKDGLARVVWAGVAANCSLLICHYAITLANAISRQLQTGVTSDRIASTLLPYDIVDGGLIVYLLYSTVALLMLLVTLVWVARNALLVLVVVAAPLALICHAVPRIDAVAVLWWRSLAALLAAQVGQAVVFIAAMRIFFSADGRSSVGISGGGRLVNAELAVCLAYLMFRIPGWARKLAFRGGGSHTIVSLVRLATVQQLLRQAGAQVLSGRRSGHRPSTPRQNPPGDRGRGRAST